MMNNILKKKIKFMLFWLVLLILTFFLAIDIAFAMSIPIVLFWFLFLLTLILIALDIKYILAPYSVPSLLVQKSISD